MSHVPASRTQKTVSRRVAGYAEFFRCITPKAGEKAPDPWQNLADEEVASKNPSLTRFWLL